MEYEVRHMKIERYPVTSYTLDDWTAGRIKEIKFEDVGHFTLVSTSINQGDILSLPSGNWVVESRVLICNEKDTIRMRLYVDPYNEVHEKSVCKQRWKERIPLFPDKEENGGDESWTIS